MPWLYELVLFEWTLGQAFDADNATMLSEQAMVAIPPDAWPELRFEFHPSIQRLDLEWNVPALWKALTAENPVPVTAEHEPASPWLVWRDGLTTRYRSLPRDEQHALDVLRTGGDFIDMCAALSELVEEGQVAMRAASLLKGWLAQGLVSGIR
jgi:hypothetical protein